MIWKEISEKLSLTHLITCLWHEFTEVETFYCGTNDMNYSKPHDITNQIIKIASVFTTKSQQVCEITSDIRRYDKVFRWQIIHETNFII